LLIICSVFVFFSLSTLKAYRHTSNKRQKPKRGEEAEQLCITSAFLAHIIIKRKERVHSGFLLCVVDVRHFLYQYCHHPSRF